MAERTAKKQGKGRKGRKIGHWASKPTHKRYVAERRWILNKARKFLKHLRKHPKDIQSSLNPEVRRLILSNG
jgi:hypothetical protein